LTGQTPRPKRRAVVEQFKNISQTRILFANIDVGGIGLNLQFASNVAIVQLPWTPGQCTQAEDRVHRIGQTKPANIYYLLARDTIDVDLCQLLQQKQETITSILDGDGRGEALDILDRLITAIMRGEKHASNGSQTGRGVSHREDPEPATSRV
jgi:SNF2 family DNA or RNA helicase